MKRFTFTVAALTGLLLAGAVPEAEGSQRYGHGKHSTDRYDQRYRGHPHDRYCDHGSKYRGRIARHGYQPFYDDRAYGGYVVPRHRGRYANRQPRGHRHHHYPVASIHRAYRHDWRWCDAHGGWFRIGDFVLLY